VSSVTNMDMLQKLLALAAWGSLAFIAFATLSPIGLRPHLADARIEQLAAFSLAGVLFSVAYPHRVLPVIALVLGSAILLELLQLITPDRHGRALDLALKLLGGSTGIACAWVGRFLRRLLEQPSS
jgi:hypothetical protein